MTILPSLRVAAQALANKDKCEYCIVHVWEDGIPGYKVMPRPAANIACKKYGNSVKQRFFPEQK